MRCRAMPPNCWRHVAESARQTGRRGADLGFHDASGDPEHNADLAKRRAQAVRHALEANGVAAPPSWCSTSRSRRSAAAMRARRAASKAHPVSSQQPRRPTRGEGEGALVLTM